MHFILHVSGNFYLRSSRNSFQSCSRNSIRSSFRNSVRISTRNFVRDSSKNFAYNSSMIAVQKFSRDSTQSSSRHFVKSSFGNSRPEMLSGVYINLRLQFLQGFPPGRISSGFLPLIPSEIPLKNVFCIASRNDSDYSKDYITVYIHQLWKEFLQELKKKL